MNASFIVPYLCVLLELDSHIQENAPLAIQWISNFQRLVLIRK